MTATYKTLTEQELIDYFKTVFEGNNITKRGQCFLRGKALRSLYKKEGLEGLKLFLSNFDDLLTDGDGCKFLKRILKINQVR